MGRGISTLATRLRPLAVAAVRALPPFRGRGRIADALNRALLRSGAEPVVLSRMAAGHSLWLDCRINAHMHALFSGGYDGHKLAALSRFLPPGGVALDIGANIGFYAVPLGLAAQRAGGRLVAVEPLPENMSWLRRNFELNGVAGAIALELGLSAVPGAATLTLREDFLTGASVGNASIADARTDEGRFRQVPIRLETLDGLWPSLGVDRLDVVKLDIEGHEDAFLEGGERTLGRYRPVILVEVNRWYYERRGIDFDARIPPLLPRGYGFYTVDLRRLDRLSDCADNDVLAAPLEKIR